MKMNRTKSLGLLLALMCGHFPSAGTAEVVTIQADPNVSIAQGYFREYAVDDLRSGPAIVAIDDSDDVWVALARSGKLVRLRNETLSYFDIGQDSRPVAIKVGTAGNGSPNTIWISAAFDEKLVRFDRQSGVTKKFSLGDGTMWPFMIDIGPSGDVWFSERAAGRIGCLDPQSGEIKHYPLPTENAGPAGLAVDEHTGTVWFSQGQVDRIGRLDPRDGRVTDYTMSATSTGMTSGPAGIAIAPDGSVWFAKLEGKLGRLYPSTGRIELVEVPEAARRPAGIAIGPDQNIWSVTLDGNSLLRYEPSSRKFTLYPLPTGSADRQPSSPPAARTARPFGLAFDSRGNLWFSEQYTGQLGVIALGPPELRIHSPREDVSAHDPFVTVAALDRVSGIARIEYRLDDRPVMLSSGRLSLLDSMPGRHRLTVTATNHAGFSSTVISEFQFVPNSGTITALIDQLQPINEAGRERIRIAIENVRRAPQSAGRSKALHEILESFTLSTTDFANFPFDYVHSLANYFQNANASFLEVKVLDDKPWFSPERMSVHVGDMVTWKYEPSGTGHVMPQSANRIEIENDHVTSPSLRPGESFGHRFTHIGSFPVTNLDRPGARLIVEVVQ